MEQKFAEKYGELVQWHWWFRGRQQVLKAVLRSELSTTASLAVGSLGCGPIDGLAWVGPLTARGGLLVGVDERRACSQGLNWGGKFVVGRVETVPLASGSLDVALVLDVLEHLDDDAAGLREAARLLKPTGLLLVTVPALPSLWGGQDIVGHHRRRYTKRTLRNVFARARLPSPRVTYFNTLLFPVVAAIRWRRLVVGLGRRALSDFDDNHRGMINDLLTSIFALERHLIGRVSMPFGVSLLATMRTLRT
jgi:SAM-dependent methyltransferase